jgi:hypothetical protein
MCTFASSWAAAPNNQSMYILPASSAYHLLNFLFLLLCFFVLACECGYVGDDGICANELVVLHYMCTCYLNTSCHYLQYMYVCSTYEHHVQYAYVHPCKEDMQCLLCSSAGGAVNCLQACIVQQSIIKTVRTTRTLALLVSP